MAESELKIAGMKLMIEGGAQFTADLNTAKTTSKMLTTELKLLEAGTTSAGKNGMEFLRAKSEALTSKLAQQEAQTKITKIALQEASSAAEVDAKQVQKLEDAVTKSRIEEEKLKVELVNVNGQLEKATNSALQHAIAQKKMGEDAEKAGKQVKGAGDNLTKYVTAPALAAAAALAALIAKTLESADGIQLASDKYGLSAERVQELTYAGKGLDVEFDTMASSQSKLIKAMTAAKDPTTAQGKAFDTLGVSVTNADGSLRNSNDVWGEVIDKLGKMPNETEASSTAMVLLGKSAMDLNPLIKAGSTELANLSEEAHKTGAVMSNENVAALDSFGDSIEKAKVSITTAAGEITVKMLPTLNKLLPIIQKDIVPTIGKFAEGVGDLIVGFDSLDPIAKDVVATLAGIAVVAGPVLEIAGTGITLYGTLTTAAGVHAIATASDASAVNALAASETVAVGTGTALAATLAPIIILSAALAGTAIAYEALTADSRAATAEVTNATDAMIASNKAYGGTISDANDSAAATKNMTDKLYALADVENKTNAQKAQMKGLVASLNSAIPNLSLAYDDQTNSLNKNKDAVYDMIDAKLAQLKSTAYENQITKAYQDQITQADLYAKALDRYNKASAKITTVMDPISAAKARGEFEASYDALIAVSKASDSTNASLASAEQGYSDLATAAAETADTAAESADTITAAVALTADELKAQSEATKTAVDEQNKTIKQFYADMAEAKQKHLDEMGSIDQKGIEQNKLTAEEVKANLEQQIEDFKTWRSSIAELSSRVPSDVMSALENLGPEYTGLIDDLNKMTDEELEAWVDTWREKGALAEKAAEGTRDTLQGVFVGMHNTFYGMGVDAINGLIEGMNSKGPAATAQAQYDAERLEKTYRKTLDSHSPSRKMIEVGGDVVDGVIVGMKNKQEQLVKQSEVSANSIIDGFSVSPAVSLGALATSRAMSASSAQSSTVNNSKVDASTVVNMSGAVFNVRSESDIDQIATALAKKVADQRKAVPA